MKFNLNTIILAFLIFILSMVDGYPQSDGVGDSVLLSSSSSSSENTTTPDTISFQSTTQPTTTSLSIMDDYTTIQNSIPSNISIFYKVHQNGQDYLIPLTNDTTIIMDDDMDTKQYINIDFTNQKMNPTTNDNTIKIMANPNSKIENNNNNNKENISQNTVQKITTMNYTNNTTTQNFNEMNPPKNTTQDNNALNLKSQNKPILFAPYVDITLYPTFDLVEAKKTLGIDTVIISFIVSCVIPSCTIKGASFGGSIGIEDNDPSGALGTIDEAIHGFQKEGGQFIISFGGAYNDELALHHDTAETLAMEYQKVIEKYQPIRIDFDMEGTGLMDDGVKGRKVEEVHTLRAQALNLVRKSLKEKMPSISLCLPVNPDIGFDDKTLAVIKIMKNNGVPIDIISIMAMDYGTNYLSNGFYQNTVHALEKAYEQSIAFYPDINMGVIPMIGENDDGSILSLSEAETLVNDLKTRKYVRLLSMWSINRDKNDGEFTSLIKNTFKYPMESPESNKKSFQYSRILKKFLN